MALLPKSAKGQENIPGSETHLDADTLAAFAEHSQRYDEEAAVFAHLAECEICREYLAANGELKEFDWNAGKPRHHCLLRPALVSRSVRTAAGIACAVATFLLWFSSQQSRRTVIVSTSKVSMNDLAAALASDGQPTAEASKKTLAKEPDNLSRSTSRFNMRSAAIPNFTTQIPHSVRASWRNVSLQKPSTDEPLAARNFHRFFEMTLATVSLGGGRTTGDANNTGHAVNQIALQTALGERWITVEGFWKASRWRLQQ